MKQKITILGVEMEVDVKPPRRIWCEKCRDKEWIVWRDKDGYEYAEPCECQFRNSAIYRLKNSGLADLVEKYSFDTFWVRSAEQDSLKKAAMKYAEQPQGWFFVGGQVGAGKTHICTAISAELISRGKDVRYMRWRQDSETIKRARFNGDDSELNKYVNSPFLYIDDLWKGEPTEQDLKLTFEIIATRYERKKKTIISSEKTLPEIMQIDEGIGSRILQMTNRENRFAIGRDIHKNVRLYPEGEKQ